MDNSIYEKTYEFIATWISRIIWMCVGACIALLLVWLLSGCTTAVIVPAERLDRIEKKINEIEVRHSECGAKNCIKHRTRRSQVAPPSVAETVNPIILEVLRHYGVLKDDGTLSQNFDYNKRIYDMYMRCMEAGFPDPFLADYYMRLGVIDGKLAKLDYRRLLIMQMLRVLDTPINEAHDALEQGDIHRARRKVDWLRERVDEILMESL